MVESHIEVNFVYRGDVETAFTGVVAWLDEEERPTCSRRGEYRLGFADELVGCTLKIKRSEKHLYDYDGGIMTFVVLCERLGRPDGSERLDAALSFVKYVYTQTDPQYVFGMHDWRAERIPKDPDEFDYALPSPITDEGLAQNWINHPTWLMIFPPELVEVYGREWLLNLPAETVEELDDGAIMTVATESILNCQSDTEIAQEIGDAMEPIEQRFQQRDI